MSTTLRALFRGVLVATPVVACRLDQPSSPSPTGPAALAQIVLVPAVATLAAGTSQQFTAYGRTVSGDSVATTVTFAASGGTVSGAGLYAAGSTAGTFLVIATSATTNLADTSIVTVQASPLAQLLLVPAVVAVAAGGSVQFQVYGRTIAGDSVALGANYAATGGAISAAGRYTAESTPGTFQVIATQSGGTLADTSTVTVTAAAPICASSATMLCPGDNIQAKATAAGTGATLTLQPGIYRLQTVTPLANQRFLGQPGAILSGAKLLTGWSQSGSTWYVTGQTQQFADVNGTCASGTACQYQEDVYRDNVLLTRVLSLGAVTTGTFYFDYAADRIYVGDDPSGHVLEGAAIEYAFQGNLQGAGSGVTIQGLIIEKYATPAGMATVGHTGPGDNWTISNCEVRYNHGTGVGVARSGTQVLNNYIHHNGQLGIGGSGDGPGVTGNALIQGNEIAYNNTAGFAPGWEAGGLKFTHYATAFTVQGNFIHHNSGYGLWSDGYSDRMLYEDNRVEDNAWAGIVHEVSYSATIRNNTVQRNGFSTPSANEGAGIEITNSGGSGADIYGNTLVGNKHAIILLQASRGTAPDGTPLVTRNVSVHDNTVTLGPGQLIGVRLYGGGDTAVWTTLNNHFEHNTYNLQTADAAPFEWTFDYLSSAVFTDAQWRAIPNDSSGTFNR